LQLVVPGPDLRFAHEKRGIFDNFEVKQSSRCLGFCVSKLRKLIKLTSTSLRARTCLLWVFMRILNGPDLNEYLRL